MDYDENFARFQISDDIYDEWTKNHQPYIATFELTPQCNFQCIHCYLGVHRTEPKILSYEQIIAIIDQLKDAGVLQLALTGGECTLRPDFPAIYEYAKKSGFIVSVFSNMSYLPEELLEMFKKYPPFSVEVSLYGASEDTYKTVTGHSAYRRVMQNLRTLHSCGIRISLKAPLILQNHKDQAMLEEIAHSIGTNLRIGFAMSPTIDQELYPVSFAIGIKERFLHEVENLVGKETGYKDADMENPWGDILDKGGFAPQFICNPGVSDVFVTYEGKVCPCVAYRSKGISLLEHDFFEIWDSFRNLKQIPALPDNKCIRCESRYLCNICVGEQDELYGDMCHRPLDVCVYAQARKRFYKDKQDISEILSFIDDASKALG